MENTNLKKDLTFLFYTVLSATIHSISLVTFSIPAKLYPGGFSGICRLLVDILNDYGIVISFSILYLFFNLLTAIFVYRHVGKKFAIFSCIQFGLVSLFTTYFKPVIEVSDPLLIAVFGGIVAGFGISLALSHNASSGGTDFIAVYVSNRFKCPIWNYVMLGNCCILSIAGIRYGWDKALYSIILQFCSTQVINNIHKRYQMETLTIVTSKRDEVANAILACVRHGITEFNATGAYRHLDEDVLYTVVNSFQTREVCKAVLSADPKAFINIQPTRKVIGNYFQKPLD